MKQLAALARALPLAALAGGTLLAQTVTPSSILSNGADTHNICITLPSGATIDKADVFLLFDDTGSFASYLPQVRTVFQGIVTNLQASLPGVDFAFGVGRLEEYGGPYSTTYSSANSSNRPFLLNQAILRTSSAGFAAAIDVALLRTAPGTGGGNAAASLEALFQAATGAGFDGNGNATTSDSGAAGSLLAQTNPGTSGDIPAYSTYVGSGDGTLGGVGWRADALHICILATDVVPVAAFDRASGIPTMITGAGGLMLPVTAFGSTSTVPNANTRFGFISLTLPGNLADVVAPPGAATVQGAITALNNRGIRVIGLTPVGGATTNTNLPGSPTNPTHWLSATARLTGAVDSLGNPLVFNIATGATAIADAIASAVQTTAALPIDITVTADPALPLLSVTFTPTQVAGVPPGGNACFDVTFLAAAGCLGGTLDLNFRDVNGLGILGFIPVTVVINQPPVITCNPYVVLWSPDHSLVDVSSSFTAYDPDNDPLVLSVQCYSNEDEVPHPGDGTGKNAPDFKDEQAGRGLLVRSERAGTGTGRFYVFFVTADDGRGGVTRKACIAALCPHDKGDTLEALEQQAMAAAAAIEAALLANQPLPPGIFQHGLASPLGPKQ